MSARSEAEPTAGGDPLVALVEGLEEMIHRGDSVDLPQLARRYGMPLNAVQECYEGLRALAPRRVDPLGEGDRIPGYELGEVISKGGMGAVYRAQDLKLGREVALKVLLNQRLASPAAHDRFEREAVALAKLRHPQIVQVHAYGEHHGCPYLIMEMVQGASLDEYLRLRGGLSPEQAAGMVMSLAGAVHYAHSQGVLHRDLKPSNVLVLSDGQPKLIDFGLTRSLGDDTPSLTKTGVPMGTIGFSPPEQLLGRLDLVGPRSDVYGLGAILYALLTEEPPGSNPSELRHRLKKRPPGVDPELWKVCAQCLEEKPEQRYSDADDLRRALQASLEGKAPRLSPSAILGLVGVSVAVGIACAAFLFSPGPAGGEEPPLVVPTSSPPGSVSPISTRRPPVLRLALPNTRFACLLRGGAQALVIRESEHGGDELELWSLDDEQLLGSWQGLSDTYGWSPLTGIMVYQDWALRLNLLDTASRESRPVFLEGGLPRRSNLAVGPGAELVASWHDMSRVVRVHDLSSGVLVATLERDQGTAHMCAFSPSGQDLLVVNELSKGPSLTLWNLPTEKRSGIRDLPRKPRTLLWDPSGTSLLVGDRAGRIVAHKVVRNGETTSLQDDYSLLRPLGDDSYRVGIQRAHFGQVEGLAWVGGQLRSVTTDPQLEVVTWDTTSRKPLEVRSAPISNPQDRIAVDLDPSGEYLLLSYKGRAIERWEVKSIPLQPRE